MTLNDLIEQAAKNAGTLKELASEMGKHQNRLTEWKKGTHKPDADEIAFLARKAGLPVIETVAEIQMSLDSRYAEIWREALGKLKAAGVAASAILILGMGFPAEKANADNGLASLHSGAENIHRSKYD